MDTTPTTPTAPVATEAAPATTPEAAPMAEHPARARPEPTRYGDWELNGKCVDF